MCCVPAFATCNSPPNVVIQSAFGESHGSAFVPSRGATHRSRSHTTST